MIQIFSLWICKERLLYSGTDACTNLHQCTYLILLKESSDILLHMRCIIFYFYYIDASILWENTPLVKFIRNCIRDLSGVFSISSLVKISMTSFPTFSRLFVFGWLFVYIIKNILHVSSNEFYEFYVLLARTISHEWAQYGSSAVCESIKEVFPEKYGGVCRLLSENLTL